MNISRATAEDLAELLEEVWRFLDYYADVEDGDYGQPEPNKAMRLCSRCQEAASHLDGLLELTNDPS